MAENDWRRTAFEARFSAAAQELGASGPLQIESLKFRDLRGHSADYARLMGDLALLSPTLVEGNYGGTAWKLTDSDGSAVIVVEHETGLEILSAAGDVATIVSLVLAIAILALKGYRHRTQPFSRHFSVHEAERRRLDGTGNLIEEPALDLEASAVPYLIKAQNDLTTRLHNLEREVKRMNRGPNAKGRTGKAVGASGARKPPRKGSRGQVR